jgi:hypothetical protein
MLNLITSTVLAVNRLLLVFRGGTSTLAVLDPSKVMYKERSSP